MISRRLHIILAAVLLLGAATVRADSVPIVRGNVSGFEVCAQSMCGSAGTLVNNGDGTFRVHVDMRILLGGAGTLQFDGELSHNVFPPSIIGLILQTSD
jgi:hypothetical protein